MSSTEPGPVIVAGHLIVDADTRSDYLESCEAVVRSARATAGCLDFAISADLVDPSRINIYEHWRDPAALQSFRGQGPDDDQTGMLKTIHVAEHRIAPNEQH